jgi:PKD domain-containing protein/VCBS repeat protein/cadherin-like protein/Big-like domain-containing protein
MKTPAISRPLAVSFALFVLAAGLPGSSSAFSLFTRSGLAIGSHFRVTAADLNRDGALDLVAINGASTVSVLLGNGDGTFGPLSTLVAGNSSAVAAGDANGDGIPDLLVGNDASVVLLIGVGDGTFGPPSDLETGEYVPAVRLADLNSDGRLDAVVGTGGGLFVRLGNGNGTFGPRINTDIPDACGGDILPGDLNVDGRLDLVVIGCSSAAVVLGNGDGTFLPPVNYPVADYLEFYGDVGDLNGDGHPDIVVSTAYPSTVVSVLMGNGDGTFLPKVDFNAGLDPDGVKIGDLNSDGIPDLAVAVYAEKTLALLAGRGDGTFESRVGFPAGSYAGPLEMGDWNRDGLLDLAVATDDGISLFQNSTGPPAGNPPVVTAPPTVTGQENSLITFTVTASDPDGDPLLSLAAVDLPGDATFTADATNTSGTFLWTPPLGTGPNTYQATFVAYNTLSASARTSITVEAVDQPPVLAVIVSMTVAPGATRDQGVSATDPEGDAITFTSSGPAFMTLTSNAQAGNTRTGNIHLAPPVGTSGTFQASLTATANGQFDDQAFVITVRPPAQGFSFTRSDIPVASSPLSIATADFNLDGVLDLAVTSGGNNLASVLLGNPDGTFGPRADFATGAGPYFIAAGDVSLDGKPDLLVANIVGETVSVLLGIGNGSFAPATEFDARGIGGPFGPAFVGIADLNRDGRPDAVMSAVTEMIVRLGNGDGTFGARIDLPINGRVDFQILAADLNHDGLIDLAFGNRGVIEAASIRLGNGDGTFRPQVDYPVAGGSYFGDVGDLNADGHPDLVFSTNPVAGSRVSVLLGRGDGTFLPETSFETGYGTSGVKIGDFNLDNIPDIAAAGYWTNSLDVLPGRGDGTFDSRVPFAGGGYCHAMALGDWNRDGLPDVVITDNTNSRLYVFRNTAVATGPPVLAAIANTIVAPGATADQGISATDPDGDAITFTSSGPAFMTLTSNAQSGNTRTGNLHLAPSIGTSGTFQASVTATANSQFDDQTFVITVRTNSPPTLAQPANMTVNEGAIANQTLSGTDPDGDPLTFSKVAGPTYVTVTTTNPTTGVIHLAPGFSDAGTAPATVRASDGSLTSDKSLTITVTNLPRPPVLAAIANMTVSEGATANQTLSATDPDGDALTFSKLSGPTYMTVTTINPGTGTGTGNVNLAPGLGDAGTASATARVTDGSLSSDRTFLITVRGPNHAPALNAVADMTLDEGTTADQTLTATDPDGDALTFTKVSGPSFMTVTTNAPGTGTGTGNIHLAPGFADAGTYSGAARASDGSLSNDRLLTITVNNVTGPPVLAVIANMTVAGGSTADQGISATDPDADAITFTSSGPAFMTVASNAQVGFTRTGNIHLAPSIGTTGTFPGTVTATANAASSTRNFAINVTAPNNPPTLIQPANMTVNEGATANQTLTATDPDGNPLTFSKVSGPTYATVTTTTPGSGTATGNVNLAPGFVDAGTSTVVLRVSDGSLSNDKSFVVTINNLNRSPVLAQPTNMTVDEGATADQTIAANDADGQALTFAKVVGPTFMTVATITPGAGTATGNINLAPGLSDSGTYSATVRASDGTASNDKTLAITVNQVSPPGPTLAQPANMTVSEGSTADQALTASDPDGDPLTFSKVAGPIFMTVTTTSPGAGTATGNLHLAPGFTDTGTYPATVRVSDASSSTSKSLTITVVPVNRCPTANPGKPYSAILGVPVTFDGTGSSDPDGDPLTYAWDFDASDGIGVDATGPTPMHAYVAAGTFTVTLTVRDNGPVPCSDSAATTAEILAACPATVFNGYDVIRLGTGKPFWFAFVQPATGCYVNSDVVLSSFVLKYAGNQIAVDPKKTFVDSDRSGDGIAELRVSFSKANLRALFAGLPNGHNLVDVTIEASLGAGGLLRGTTQVDVLATGSSTAATVAPNPFNPSGTLTFTTSRRGFARVELFDVGGRLVRKILDEGSLPAGAHDVKIEGRGLRGESLASGIYFLRGVSVDGEFTKTITILK